MPLEREVKLRVGAGFELPNLSGLGLRLTDRGTHLLEATYWDTPSLALFRAHRGLRHRTRDGGAGTWTLKGPSAAEGSASVREETEMGGGPAPVPAGLVALVRDLLGDQQLRPMARLRTLRHTIDVLNGERPVAEIADDRVGVLDAGGSEAATFREVEVELADGSAVGEVDGLVAQLRAAGAIPDSSAKYSRALAALGLIEDPATERSGGGRT